MEHQLSQKVGMLLRRHGLKLGLAESCTGGLIADRLTDVPGASEYFVGGIVCYANQTKVRLLGVSPKTLELFGAVSGETVREMAAGARNALEVDMAVAVSGVAGPGGGSIEKPVGTVWIGLATRDSTQAWPYYFEGDRRQNKAASADQALRLVLEHLQESR